MLLIGQWHNLVFIWSALVVVKGPTYKADAFLAMFPYQQGKQLNLRKIIMGLHRSGTVIKQLNVSLVNIGCHSGAVVSIVGSQ